MGDGRKRALSAIHVVRGRMDGPLLHICFAVSKRKSSSDVMSVSALGLQVYFRRLTLAGWLAVEDSSSYPMAGWLAACLAKHTYVAVDGSTRDGEQ